MAVTADSVVVELIAKTDGYTAVVTGAASATETSMSRIERSASRAEGQIVRSSAAMANAQRNLGRQIADIGVGLSSGQSPFLILAQQAPQVADALADTGGRAARVASFFAGPWGAALLAAGSVAALLAEKLFSLKSAHDEVKAAAEATAEAERLLAGVLGGTANQSERARIASLDRARAMTYEARATLNNAQAQLTLARAYAAAAAATERAAPATMGIPGRGAASSAITARQRQTDVDIAQGNLNALEIRLRNLEKVAGGARAVEAKRESDKQDKADAAAARKAAAAARRAEREAEKQAREQAQFVSQRLRGQAELADAEAALTSDTRLQDEATRKRIIAERDAAKAQINADPDRSKAQKSELASYEDRIANARLRLVNINEAQRFLDETLALQKAELDGQADALNEQGNLAETNVERRNVALRLLDLAFERERLELESVLASKKTTEVEKQIAQKRLAQLGGLFGARREGVERQYEGVAARYQRQTEAVGRNLSEAVDGIAVDGLEALNTQLTDAVVNSKNLGDAFRNVSRQIVADLLRIAIQQAVIKPLAQSLFGGSGGGGGIGASIAGLFGRASGGYVGPGQTVRVNEGASRGPELLRMGAQGGTVIPLGQTRAERPASAASMPPVVIQLAARKGDAFAMEVLSVTGPQTVQILQQAAPGLVQAATVNTVAELRKPGL
ncbi:phage tail length tape measure family protein [Sphingomonas sp. 1P08PE]|uniref:phage tail length tape measure family protein n=1 Tax=Sphingomonas sp. 1P08PE TaxID=554122 RepID=UPI0039A0ED02